jgi:hypothetical protein
MPRSILTRRALGPIALCVVAVLLVGCTTTTATTPALTAPPTGTGVGQPSLFLGANLSDVACATTLLCSAVADSFDPYPSSPTIATSLDGGLSWKQATGNIPNGAAYLATSCAAKLCMATGRSLAGSLAYVSPQPGAAWKATKPIESGAVTQAVACAGIRWCVTISSDSTHIFASTSQDAGTVWTAAGTLPAGSGAIQELSCSTTLVCLATGSTVYGAPEIDLTTDSGQSWTVATLPTAPAITGILGASCRSDSICLVVVTTSSTGATALIESTDGGASFGASVTPIAPVTQPLATSCVSTTCVVVGRSSTGAGAAVELLGAAAARAFRLSFAPTGLLAVSCPTPSRCVAASTASLVVLSPSVPKPIEKKPGKPLR